MKSLIKKDLRLTLALMLTMLTVVVLLQTQRVQAYPKPAFVQPKGVWQLDFELHGDPEAIWVRLPGDAEPKRFWYILYTITNNTGADIEFYPQFDLLTDTLKLYHAGEGVRRPVFEAIRERYRHVLPLLEPENMVMGTILQGRDNARTSAAVFADFDPEATTAKIFVEGLSNETIAVEDPNTNDSENDVKEILLRKTLMLKYQIVGDPANPTERTMLYRSREWVMR